jgi:hypothetical protein
LKKEIEDAIRSIQVPADGFSRPGMNEEIEKQLTTRLWENACHIRFDLTGDFAAEMNLFRILFSLTCYNGLMRISN